MPFKKYSRGFTPLDTRKANLTGFTLVELLVVIAIIAVLATLTIFAFFGTRAKVRDAKRLNDLNQIGRFLSFSCLTPETGPGEYDLNELIDVYKSKYPQYTNIIPTNIRDPKIGTDKVSNYKYIVSADNKCVLYANLENDKEEITLPGLSEPTPGGGKGIFTSPTNGWNGSNKYFQVSN
ncbi:MAG: type II secretion system protein [Patescibacteria group bacterium]|nr:type II secretion system protein [Patescibacteria group bacterium]MDD5294776.1 type II secretion system protein [Patescibacteria group bacterium]MDD5554340.1 type II secretion system protein [Patescibacteria group bacterium]